MRALATCDDEAPSASSSELMFIMDADFRRALRVDLGTIETALRNSEWKAATVLDEWVLGEYTDVAAELGVITANTAVQARLAKDFRNLIHPGRAVRLRQACNRGTALSAFAAVEHVIGDIGRG